MKIINIIKKWLKDSDDKYKARITRQESVSCPHCEQYYSSHAIGKLEFETAIENLSTIKCIKCGLVFGVKVKRYYEPCPSMFRSSIKLS